MTRRPSRSRACPRRGFTVVEILVVLGVVIGIISTLVVGLNIAARRARVANTEFLMNSIVSGLTRFRAETGYLPPLLGDPSAQLGMSPSTPSTTGSAPTVGWARDVLAPPAMPGSQTGGPNYGSWSAQQKANLQKWCSYTTIPEYLLGIGDRSQDGYGVIMDSTGALPASGTPGYREQPTLGIRNPGSDGAWGSVLNPRPGTSGNGLFASRNLAVPNATQGNQNNPISTGAQQQTAQFLSGKSLGPYIEVKNQSELGAIVGFQSNGTANVGKVGEINNFDAAPKCILDYFGRPLVFYRRGYLNGDPRSLDKSWSLADIVALRPQRVMPGEEMDAMADANGDTTASRAARAAEYALLSFGPDTKWDPTVRADTTGYNEDNIVRFGP